MISIVIPARNEEFYLPDCLSSLKEQSYTGDYEIIVVDNGSTDETAAIAESFGTKVIFSFNEISVFHARAAGADVAHGDIIVQADADTIYPPHWLQRIADKMESHPEVAAVSGRFFYREKFTWAWIELNGRHIINILYTFFLGHPLIISGATFAFRRDIFTGAGGYEGLSYAADQIGIAERLTRYGKVIYDPKLYVMTSARSVRKPNTALIKGLLGHIYLLTSHRLAGLFPNRPPSRKKKLAKSPAWELSVLLVFALTVAAGGNIISSRPDTNHTLSKNSTCALQDSRFIELR